MLTGVCSWRGLPLGRCLVSPGVRRLLRERRAWRQTRLFSGGMPLLEPAAGSTSRWMFPSFELFESMRCCGVLESRTASEMTDVGVLRLGRRVTPPRLVTG